MTIKELIEKLKEMEDPELNVFIPVKGQNYCNVVTEVKEDVGFYEKLAVLKTS